MKQYLLRASIRLGTPGRVRCAVAAQSAGLTAWNSIR